MTLVSKSLPVLGSPMFWVPGDKLSDTGWESGVRAAQALPNFPKNEAWERQAFRPPHLLSLNSTLKRDGCQDRQEVRVWAGSCLPVDKIRQADKAAQCSCGTDKQGPVSSSWGQEPFRLDDLFHPLPSEAWRDRPLSGGSLELQELWRLPSSSEVLLLIIAA